ILLRQRYGGHPSVYNVETGGRIYIISRARLIWKILSLSNYDGAFRSAISNSGRYIVSYETDFTRSSVKLWDAPTGGKIQSASVKILGSEAKPAGTSDDDRRVIFLARTDASKLAVSVNDIRTGAVLFECTGYYASATISPNGKYAVLLKWDDHHKKGGIEVWSIDTRQLVSSFGTPGGKYLASQGYVICSPDSTKILSSCINLSIFKDLTTPSHDLIVWDLKTGRKLHSQNFVADVSALAFSSDSRWVVCGDRDGMAHLWALPL
ncbi:MAG TPA: hypothetical protein VN783_01715, partial [Thermoanaerobaculia bacterium]|nr:hypothetical protein [Thermoanaerobaculia bacterium]